MLAVAVCIALADQVSAMAQPDVQDINNRLIQLNSEGKPLAAVQMLEDALRADNPRDREMFIKQMLAQQMTFAGQYSRAIDLWDALFPLGPADAELPAEELARLTPVPALDAIVAEARKHRVVIINEAHNEGATRAFNRRVVRALAAQGFRYLAMETLAPAIDEANLSHRVTRDLGFYVNDPVYASIMRSAWAAGYRLLAYEDRDETQGDRFDTSCDASAKEDWVGRGRDSADTPRKKSMLVREKNQACTLAQAIGKMPTNAKMIIVAGYSHVRKVHDWMAGFLAAYTGEDILAIDQTEQDDRKTRSEGQTLIKQIYAAFPPAVETVLRKPDGTYLVPGSLGRAVDMAVFRPNPKDKDNWWLPDDELKEVMLDAPGREADWPLGLVSARPPGAGSDIVPFDNFYVGKSGLRQVRLLLPKGVAEIWLDTGTGDAVKIRTVEVADHG